MNTLLALALLAVLQVAARPKIEDLAWLTGNWTLERNGRTIDEQWMASAGKTMLGMSRTVSGGKTSEFEFLHLSERENGDIVYQARPSGQTPTDFKLAKLTPNEAVFENPAHDFPQRILYKRNPDGSLTAAIEGQRNGQLRRIEFQYQRSKSL